ncbi:crossover junction endodeoxyribonuclease RuvC [Nanchangia anserum]|uniref:Crossover junction endodeoxyribonuclease RuvC n=1 Tax=Nanchangia anserum TaxID=2692125 RepID=A0A8I0GD99_9ACTO|nr:crossover junction endodeoxyribonuclease RuvC [Nanchangia anserum]MBD3688752.1 crossover junction endodeoxyribonuclease RuvC [Nanchangia anserum]QOX82494.1 crossover junction endodeoxyribonuclease RuvC [Nanchangia anserum]
MRILGIDPGITRCGIGVIDMGEDRRARLVHVEVARSPATLATHFRLRDIGQKIEAAIDRFAPDVAAIERVFAHDNLQSVTTTMQVMGVAMYCAGTRNLAMAVHTPSQVKSAVTGSGVASKAQVQHMVSRILGLDGIVRPADAADALAIAICHGWRGDNLQGEGGDEQFSVSLSGGVTTKKALTPAQQQWAQAQALARRTGAVDPRRGRR